ncbi:restriction endonuclease subunit M [Planctomycetales bacterium]|nr:restriction endonuclease subunit M [Planctomycetales bacterium]
MNQLFYGDNLEVLQKHIGDETVDLCYVDPPFNSKRTYNQIYNNVGKDDIAQSQAFIDTWTWNVETEVLLDKMHREPQYTERLVETIDGFVKILGKGSLLSYLVNMAVRAAEIWRVLKPTGSFYLHCDLSASHYLKIVLDSIFCDRGGKFNNEIIWRRHYSHNDGKKFGCIHDTIFYYTKSKDYTYHRQHLEYDTDYIAKHYKSIDEKTNKPFRSVSMNAPDPGEARYFGDKLLEPPKGRHWRWSQERIDKAMKEGIIYFTANGVPRQKQFLERMDGIPVQDTWTDFYSLSSHDKERLGYATQKPLALLERIIKASSNEGDVVLDAFCGCGTTVDAAQSLNRKWIGVDITYNSISLILKRLKDRYGEDIENEITLFGIPKDLESATALAHKKDDRLRKEFEKWSILTYTDNQAKIHDKKGSDKGIDGLAYIVGGSALFSVKSGNVSVKDIRDFGRVIDRENAVAGVFITLQEPTKPMIQEAAALGNLPNPPGLKLTKSFPKLQIVTIQEIMDGARLNLPLPDAVVKSAEGIKGLGQNELY